MLKRYMLQIESNTVLVIDETTDNLLIDVRFSTSPNANSGYINAIIMMILKQRINILY